MDCCWHYQQKDAVSLDAIRETMRSFGQAKRVCYERERHVEVCPDAVKTNASLVGKLPELLRGFANRSLSHVNDIQTERMETGSEVPKPALAIYAYRRTPETTTTGAVRPLGRIFCTRCRTKHMREFCAGSENVLARGCVVERDWELGSNTATEYMLYIATKLVCEFKIVACRIGRSKGV